MKPSIKVKSHSFLLMGAALISTTSLVLFPPAAKADKPGSLELLVIDERTKQSVPARVELVDSQGKGYVADDALPVDGDCKDREAPFDLTLERAIAVMNKNVVNPYTKTMQFYSVGNSHMESLPAGDYKLTVHKGPEYRIGKQDVRVASGEPTKVTLAMARWTDMPEKAWYSADAHLHIARPVKELNPFLSKWLQAEDIHIANLLQFGNSTRFHNSLQYAHGETGRYREGSYIVAAGQENPRTHFRGHTIILGAKEPINFPEAYVIYQLFWEEAARQGALSGYAHAGEGFGGEYGLSIDLPLGLLNFIEILQFGRLNYRVWYNILNTGFRMTPIAGTDYPCGNANLPGIERFYTKVHGDFSFESWRDGVHEGRTFVTNGPILDFRVNEMDIGAEIILEKPGPVMVEGSVKFDPDRDMVDMLEVIVNGDLFRRFSRKGEPSEITFRIPYDVKESSWIALRASGRKQDESVGYTSSLAHTAATYLTIEGAPPISAQPRAKALGRYWLALLDDMEARTARDKLEHLAAWPYETMDVVSAEYLRTNQLKLLEAIQAAKKHFNDLQR